MISFFEKNRQISFAITIIIAVLIFYISSLTFQSSGGGGYFSYIYHFTAFSYLSLFLLIFLTKGNFSRGMIVFGIIISVIYGISDEIHQYFVPGRMFSIKDMLINSVGIITTSLAYSYYCRNRRSSR